ncbi:MAG: hypothetical protein DBX59_02075 [Bacillota bacterium]|nr:MAG: hypothetical protein DBX59_02075 [Bacillota bacterium]
MKATGIVRRIDELGRVVIPMELRKTLRLNVGTPMEIFTEKDALIFRKYSPVEGLETEGMEFARAAELVTGRVCALADNEKIVCISDEKLSEFVGAPLTPAFTARLKERKSVLINGDTGNAAPLARGMEQFVSQVIVPILQNGEVAGGVVLLDENKDAAFDGGDVKLLQLGAAFLARKFE